MLPDTQHRLSAALLQQLVATKTVEYCQLAQAVLALLGNLPVVGLQDCSGGCRHRT